MYRDKDGKVKVSIRAFMMLAIFILGLIIGFSLCKSVRTHASTIESVKENLTDWIRVFKTTDEDIKWMAEVVYYENGSGTEEMQYLTGAVVLNRRDFCNWCPCTVKEVIQQKGQYSTLNKLFTKPLPESAYLMAIKILMTPNKTPHTLIYQSRSHQGVKDYKVINGEYFCLASVKEINEDKK